MLRTLASASLIASAGARQLTTSSVLKGNCADLSGQYQNKFGKLVSVKQTNCDVEVSSVWDEAEGKATKTGVVGGNSLHVTDFDKIGTLKGKNVEFADGALWLKVEDGNQILVEKVALDDAQESKVAEQAEMTITEMCKSCNWDCYLQRYPGLQNKQWEAEHPQRKLEYIKMHYIKYGRAAGRNCQCDADQLAAKLVQQPWDAARLQGQLAEQTEILAEAAAEVELTKGCDWTAYVERYPKLRNEKWEQEKGNLDYARSHYLRFGRAVGKNCKRSPGPKKLHTGASLLDTATSYQPGSVNCADLNGQYKNKYGKMVTVKQTNCDVEVSSVWDDAEGMVTKTGHVGGNSVHVDKFDKIGTMTGKDVKFSDGALWEKIEDGKQILVEKIALDDAQESKITAQAEMTITEMCKSCNWDCYLKRYPGMKNKQWEAEHPQKGLEYAKMHYIKYGRAAGRNCQCDADMLAAKLVEQPWDAARLEGQLAEQTEVLAEAAAEVELIKGCDWNCYLDRYPKLRNEKWEQENGNVDYARSHYLRFGRAAGKNCKCSGGKRISYRDSLQQ